MFTSPENNLHRTGRLILVVGPSGAGKDALLERAKLAFANDANYVFARRIVTRAALAEDHDTLDAQDFDKACDEGAYLLAWRAHGLGYGLPASLRSDLEAGRTVIANVSRGMILAAESLGYPVTVLHVTADPVILASRIAARGRESMAEIRMRMNRLAPLEWNRAEMIELRNDGTLDEGCALMINALLRSAGPEAARA